MVFAINCNGANSFADFQQAAIASGSQSPAYAPPPAVPSTSTSTSASTSPSTIKVVVGGTNLTFSPPFVSASIGDIVEFELYVFATLALIRFRRLCAAIRRIIVSSSRPLLLLVCQKATASSLHCEHANCSP